MEMPKPLDPLLSSAPKMSRALSDSQRAKLDDFGISEDSIVDLETLSNVVLILKALSGDITAKKYMDDKLIKDRRFFEFYKNEVTTKEKD